MKKGLLLGITIGSIVGWKVALAIADLFLESDRGLNWVLLKNSKRYSQHKMTVTNEDGKYYLNVVFIDPKTESKFIIDRFTFDSLEEFEDVAKNFNDIEMGLRKERIKEVMGAANAEYNKVRKEYIESDIKATEEAYNRMHG